MKLKMKRIKNPDLKQHENFLKKFQEWSKARRLLNELMQDKGGAGWIKINTFSPQFFTQGF